MDLAVDNVSWCRVNTEPVRSASRASVKGGSHRTTTRRSVATKPTNSDVLFPPLVPSLSPRNLRPLPPAILLVSSVPTATPQSPIQPRLPTSHPPRPPSSSRPLAAPEFHSPARSGTTHRRTCTPGQLLHRGTSTASTTWFASELASAKPTTGSSPPDTMPASSAATSCCNPVSSA